MPKQKYTKPLAQALDRTLAVSIGGCTTGITPGACAAPTGYSAGTCTTGDAVGVSIFPCNPGNFAYPCQAGSRAAGGCGPVGQNANAPQT